MSEILHFTGNVTYNINWRDVQRNNVANNEDRVKFKGTMTKWLLQKQTLRTARKHTKQQYVTYI